MMAAQIQMIFKFFQLGLMHGPIADAASSEVYESLRRLRKNQNFEIEFVRLSKAVLLQKAESISSLQKTGLPTEFLAIPMGPWRDFIKNATLDEVMTLIWVHVLGFSQENVATALELSLGTIQFRLGRAVLLLGSVTRPKSTSFREVSWS